jgi:hypothetical protein
MTYKTFKARGATPGWSNNTGKEIALYGGFFDYKTPKTFRDIKTLMLCEKLPSKESQKRYGSEWWFVQADEATIDRATKLMEQERGFYGRPEIIIKGRGKQVESITPYMGTTSD